MCQTKTVAPSVYARDWADGVEVPLWIILQASAKACSLMPILSWSPRLLVDAHNMDVSIHELPRNPQAEARSEAVPNSGKMSTTASNRNQILPVMPR